MLPVVICEPDPDGREQLLAYVSDYMSSGVKHMTLLDNCSTAAEAARCLEDESGVMLMLISIIKGNNAARKDAVVLGKRALKQNRDNYLLYCLHNPADMEALINAGTRPVGILLWPYNHVKLGQLLNRIEKDYASLIEKESGQCIIVETGNTAHRIAYSDILYIEALDKKLSIHTHRQVIIVRMSISALEQTLAGTEFVRCHRSYLINTHFLESADFTGMMLTMTNGDEVPVSRSCKDALRLKLEANGRNTHAG